MITGAAQVWQDRGTLSPHDIACMSSQCRGRECNLFCPVQMDGAILVVSATDGPMPQTREHILLARQACLLRLMQQKSSCKDSSLQNALPLQMLSWHLGLR